MTAPSVGGRKRVGLFGGSFDPPHLGHALATLWVLGTGGVEEVWWVPAFQHAHGKQLTPFTVRFELCEAATRHLKCVRVDSIEADLGGESRTIDTLESLGEKHPDVEFALVIGSDLVPQIGTWKRADDLLKYRLIVVPRGANEPHETFAIPDVSSSALRRALSSADEEGAALGWLDAEVRARIDASGIYRSRED
jgi:nicotinate-nucleotide adenylyltransferase